MERNRSKKEFSGGGGGGHSDIEYGEVGDKGRVVIQVMESKLRRDELEVETKNPSQELDAIMSLSISTEKCSTPVVAGKAGSNRIVRESSIALDLEADLGSRAQSLNDSARGLNFFLFSLVEDDKENYGAEWRTSEKITVSMCFFLHAVFWAALYFNDNRMSSKKENQEWWTRLIFHQTVQVTCWSFFGYLVQCHGLKVGYARKLCHFVLFFMPLLIMALFGSYHNTFLDFTWLVCASLFVFYLFIKPIRRLFPVPVLLMFKCIDRPEVSP